MALTATATKTTRTCIVKSLDMQSPEIVSISPIKDNVVYCVSKKSTIPMSLGPVADRLSCQRTAMDRIIIFCRRYEEPPGAPDLARFRLVDMYTHCTHQSVKDVILERFTSQSSLRIVPYSLKFSRLKNFAVFADYGCTTKILSREIFTYIQAQYDLWAWPFCPCARARRPSTRSRAC